MGTQQTNQKSHTVINETRCKSVTGCREMGQVGRAVSHKLDQVLRAMVGERWPRVSFMSSQR